MSCIHSFATAYLLCLLVMPCVAGAQGVAWVRQKKTVDSVGMPVHIYDIAAADSLHAMAFGDSEFGRTLFRTSNGGATWVRAHQHRQFTMAWYDIAYPTANLALVATAMTHPDSGSALLRTADAGATWDTVWCRDCRGAQKQPLTLSMVAMHDSRAGIAAASRDAIAHTTDAGATWQYINDPTGGERFITAVACFGAGDFVVWTRNEAGDNRLYRTTDTGHAWESWPVPAMDDVVFVDREYGWCVGTVPDSTVGQGLSNILYRTTDGGRTWSTAFNAVISDYAYRLAWIAAADRRNAIAGAGRYYIHTSDGERWAYGPPIIIDGDTLGTAGFAYPSPGRGWAASGSSILSFMASTADAPAVPASAGTGDALRVLPNMIRGDGEAVVEITVAKRGTVQAIVTDIHGVEVGRLTAPGPGVLEPGTYRIPIRVQLPAGRYFLQVRTAGGMLVQPLNVLP